MPPRRSLEGKEPVTRSRIVHDLRALGVTDRSVLMVHTRMSALGWVVGGTQTVVEALLEAIGKPGTLMAYAGWEDDPYHLAKWPERWQHAYLAGLPPFDSLRSAADPDHGVVPERIRSHELDRQRAARSMPGYCGWSIMQPSRFELSSGVAASAKPT